LVGKHQLSDRQLEKGRKASNSLSINKSCPADHVKVVNEMKKPSVLISGASIAGPAVADLLVKQGFEVTVIERAGELRAGGQNVDIEGEGREVADRMGLTDAIRAAGTEEKGTEFVNAQGGTVALFPPSDGASFTSELEVPRGALSRMLYDRTRSQARYLFGEQIAAIEDRGETVFVRLTGGAEESFDLVIVAEGLRSHTRGLLFDDVELHHLGLYVGWFPIPRRADDVDNWRIYHAPGGRVVSLRPAKDIMRAMVALRGKPAGYEKLPKAEQVAMLRDRYADAGWQAKRIMDGLDPDTLEFQPVAQVRAPTWSKGRIVLLGDAAWAPSPLTGQGTSLALIGAYLLAGELGRGHDPVTALQRYELLMRPRVEEAQKLPPAPARLALPESRLGVGAVRTVARLIASRPVGVVKGLLPRREETQEPSKLPNYAGLSPAPLAPAIG
jgi:2-polyprenyl-6-methoxyphenol hydroxylase-like FAD-dependent oxidoreductase